MLLLTLKSREAGKHHSHLDFVSSTTSLFDLVSCQLLSHGIQWPKNCNHVWSTESSSMDDWVSNIFDATHVVLLIGVSFLDSLNWIQETLESRAVPQSFESCDASLDSTLVRICYYHMSLLKERNHHLASWHMTAHFLARLPD